jgi:hypothetical protein
MTSVVQKGKRVQTLLLQGFDPPPPAVYYSEEMTVEVLEDVEVVVRRSS